MRVQPGAIPKLDCSKLFTKDFRGSITSIIKLLFFQDILYTYSPSGNFLLLLLLHTIIVIHNTINSDQEPAKY